MTTRKTFTGFSTIGRKKPPFTLNDHDLIKRDILNTFHTDRGERVMRPNYGASLVQYLFEPFDDITKQRILSDVQDALDGEPRIEVVNLSTTEEQHGFRVDISLRYVTDYTADMLTLRYERNNQESF